MAAAGQRDRVELFYQLEVNILIEAFMLLPVFQRHSQEYLFRFLVQNELSSTSHTCDQMA